MTVCDHCTSVTMKITVPRMAAGKTNVRPVNLFYIIMFKIRKIKPNSGFVQQKPRSFHDDWNILNIIKLAHWSQDKMATIFQTTLSNAFSWMKILEFRLKFPWSLFVGSKLVPKSLISDIPALVQIMAWCGPGNKPLSEPMMVSLLTHICVTQPQWVNNIPALIQIMAWCRPGDKPLSAPMMARSITSADFWL